MLFGSTGGGQRARGAPVPAPAADGCCGTHADSGRTVGRRRALWVRATPSFPTLSVTSLRLLGGAGFGASLKSAAAASRSPLLTLPQPHEAITRLLVLDDELTDGMGSGAAAASGGSSGSDAAASEPLSICCEKSSLQANHVFSGLPPVATMVLMSMAL